VAVAVPDPLKNGQLAKLRLPHKYLRDIDAQHWSKRQKLIELPTEKVSICIYSNNRDVLLKRIQSTKFRFRLKWFD
jgi:hypothetical protein